VGDRTLRRQPGADERIVVEIPEIFLGEPEKVDLRSRLRMFEDAKQPVGIASVAAQAREDIGPHPFRLLASQHRQKCPTILWAESSAMPTCTAAEAIQGALRDEPRSTRPLRRKLSRLDQGPNSSLGHAKNVSGIRDRDEWLHA
jgi:hypothetical protein